MKKYIIIIVMMAFAMQLFAAVDGTYKTIISEYTLAADGSITQKVKKVLKHNTHYSFFSLFGETFIVYNSEYQNVKIDTSYTIQKDGTIIKTPANAFNEVLPSMAAKAPDYNKLTELVVSHTGLEVGATSYLEYTVTTAPDVYGSLDIEEVIGVPGADIEKYQVTVNIPKGMTLRWGITDSDVQPVINDDKYVWTFTNVKSAKGETNTPCGYGGLSHLSITTSATLADNLMPLTIETRDICRVPREYLANAKGDKDIVEAIQKYIVNDLSLCKVQPYFMANSIRQCGKMMETAYGTEAEKAVAMAKLMRAEGLQAQAVVAFHNMQKVKTIRNVVEYLVFWNGMFLSVRSLGESSVGLSRADYSVYDLNGNLVNGSCEGVKIDLKGVVTLGQQKYKVEYDYDITLPSDIVTNVEKNKSIAKEGDVKDNCGYVVYEIPLSVPLCVDTWSINRLSKERTAAFEIPYAVNEKYEYVVSFDGLSSVTKNIRKNVKNSVGYVDVSIMNDGDKIVIKRSMSINMTLIPVDKYKELLAIMKLWNNDNYRKVIVKK